MDKTLLELLEETYLDLAQQETKYIELKSKLEKILELYYIQNPKEFIDDLKHVKIIKKLLAQEHVGITEIDFSAALELSKFIFVKCKKRNDKSIVFDIVNSANIKTKNLPARKFDSGLTPQFFKPNSFYIVYCDSKYVWHWAKEVEESEGLKINNNFKMLCTHGGEK